MIFYSHTKPKKRLDSHLKNVSIGMINNLNINYENKMRNFEIVGLCHDFGKHTTFFQNTLSNRYFKNPKTYHSLLSALFSYYCIKREKNLDLNSYDLDALLAYSVVKSHHGAIRKIDEQIPPDRIQVLYEQISDLKGNVLLIEKNLSSLSLSRYFNDFLKEDIKEIYDSVTLNWTYFKYEEEKKLETYFYHMYLFSQLISSDKLDASNTNLQVIKSIDYDKSKVYMTKIIEDKKKKKDTVLDNIRNEIYKNVIDVIRKNPKNKIYSLTAPTGTGKTYTGYMAAKVIQSNNKKIKKIIYTLPYTSIIEQNYDSIKDLISSENDFKDFESNYIIKHHYLGDGRYKNKNEDISLGQQNLLIEDWQSGVVVTTFVQLFQTVIGVSNKMVKKLHSLDNSVIILDEIQAINSDYYKLIEVVLKKLSELLNIKIIIMTATKPYLLHEESFELLKDSDKYFNKLNRTKLVINIEEKTIDFLISDFKRRYDNKKNYLIVCNTIRESLDVFEQINDFIKKNSESCNHKVKYLSGNIVPADRRKVINEVEDVQERNKEKVILVSTTSVEAGVDLDFDEVYKDISPLDSIIQCAGRCNRNNRQNQGLVYIYNLIDKNGKRFSSIYKNIDLVYDFFENYKVIEEKDYKQAIDDYFLKLDKYAGEGKGDSILKSMIELDFEIDSYKPKVSNFSLIENYESYVDVLICKDKEVEDNIIKLENLYKDKIKNYDKIKDVKRQLLKFIISLPERYTKNLERLKIIDAAIIRYKDIDEYYNNETGFLRNN